MTTPIPWSLEMSTRMRAVATAVILVALAYYLYRHPPYAVAQRGELLVRTNELNGTVAAYSGGAVLILPGVHQTRVFDIRDQVYRPTRPPPGRARSSPTRAFPLAWN
jgi:hypothetical protein